jgi:hypothetical protein
MTALATLALSACQTAGTGSGNVRGTQKPVAFTWESDDADSGDITATFNSGRVYKGEYFQISRDTRVENLDPLWNGWEESRRSDGWRYWDPDAESRFVKTYRGRVLANMHSADGEYMRCRFVLNNPERGMAGGGEGRCQLSGSATEINAEFPRQS